jgi:Holliday junction resolvasome RuvABC endonuclease subunit
VTLVKSTRIKQSKGATDAILHGRVVAIDPASGAASNPGYCIMEAGTITEYGILRVPARRAINSRLKAIHETIRDELPEADILVIEDIPLFFVKKFPHSCKPLLFSCGVIMAAKPWPFVLPIQPTVWYSYVDRIVPGKRACYNKTDEHDALMLAVTAYCLAANEAKSKRKVSDELLLPQGIDIGRLVK